MAHRRSFLQLPGRAIPYTDDETETEQTVDGADFVVDEASGEADVADEVLVEVGGDAGSSLRPGDPEAAGGIEGGGKGLEAASESGAAGGEVEHDVEGPRAVVRVVTASGSSPSVASKSSGASISASRAPGLMPSFFGSGVPE